MLDLGLRVTLYRNGIYAACDRRTVTSSPQTDGKMISLRIILISCICFTLAITTRITLHRMNSGTNSAPRSIQDRINRIKSTVQHLRTKYGVLAVNSATRPNAIVSLTDKLNMEYYGIIGLGTPARQFKVLFDTGSSDMWVTSVNCHDPACKQKQQYDSSKSTTYSPIGTGTTLEYGSGTVSGIQSKDTVTIAGLEVGLSGLSGLMLY
jgi:Eukaryotic aspartyl protease